MVSLSLYVVFRQLVLYMNSYLDPILYHRPLPSLRLSNLRSELLAPAEAPVFQLWEYTVTPFRPVRREVYYSARSKECRVITDFSPSGTFTIGQEEWIPGLGPARVDRIYAWTDTVVRRAVVVKIDELGRTKRVVQSRVDLHQHTAIRLSIPAYWAYVPYKDLLRMVMYQPQATAEAEADFMRWSVGRTSIEHICGLYCEHGV